MECSSNNPDKSSSHINIMLLKLINHLCIKINQFLHPNWILILVVLYQPRGVFKLKWSCLHRNNCLFSNKILLEDLINKRVLFWMHNKIPNRCRFLPKRNHWELYSCNNNKMFSKSNNILLFNQNNKELNNSYNLNKLWLNNNNK